MAPKTFASILLHWLLLTAFYASALERTFFRHSAAKQIHHGTSGREAVCFAVTEMQCFTQPSGGLGRALFEQVVFLKRNGFNVKVLALSFDPRPGQTAPNLCRESDDADWIAQSVITPDFNTSTFAGQQVTVPAMQLLHWLQHNPGACRVLHVADFQGHGVYAALAKRAGLPYMDGVHVNVLVHGSLSLISQHTALDGHLPALFAKAQERAQIENADSAVFLNAANAAEHAKRWRLPPKVFAIPNIVHASNIDCRDTGLWSVSIKRVIFYGKMNDRKGWTLFTRGIAALDSALLRKLEIHYVGPRIDDLDYAEKARQALPRGTVVKAHYNLTSDGVVSMFRQHRADSLVVVPSYIEFQSFALYDVMQSGVPFVASDIFGHQAQVPANRHVDLLFGLSPESLAHKITYFVRRVHKWSCEPSRWVPIGQAERLWLNWHKNVMQWTQRESPTNAPAPPPNITVVIVFCDKDTLIENALKSVRQQKLYPVEKLSTVLVNACPARGSCRTASKTAASVFGSATRDFTCVEEAPDDPANDRRMSLGRARNVGVHASVDDIVLLLDEDDELDETAAATYVRAFQHNPNVHVFTSFVEAFTHRSGDPTFEHNPGRVYGQLGGVPELGFVVNALGGAYMAVNKSSSLWTLSGGFSDDISVGCEDWEFLLKAALAGRLQLIPKRGLWYRKMNGGLSGMLHELQSNPMLYSRCRQRVIAGALEFFNTARAGDLSFDDGPSLNAFQLLPTFQYLLGLYEEGETAKW